MKRRAFIVGTGMFVILNLMMLAITPMPAHAATVWSDDFDDGNLDGWTTDDPEHFSASNGYLERAGAAAANSSHIRRASTVSRGTWSFDFYVVAEYDDSLYFNGMGVTFFDYGARYAIDFEPLLITLLRREAYPAAIWGTWTPPDSLVETWHHMDTTIDDPFVVDVFVDGTHRFHNEIVLLPPTESPEDFTIELGTVGERIDNVTVSDTADFVCENATCEVCPEPPTTTTTTPPETTETTTTTPPPPPIPLELLAVGIGVPVVIIVVVVVMRMRRF